VLARPVVLADQRRLPVHPALAELLAGRGLQRGTTVVVGGGSGATSLALALASAASRAGGWVAAVDLPGLGVVAAEQMGVAVERLVLVPASAGQWATVAAVLLERVEILLLAPPGRPGRAEVRRLAARARERGSVLVVPVPAGDPRRWPEPADLRLTVTGGGWEGLQDGAGYLRSRVVEVVVDGRRAASQPRRARLWLPGPGGGIAGLPGPPASRVVGVPGLSPGRSAGGLGRPHRAERAGTGSG
jgi:hypothetical protein